MASDTDLPQQRMLFTLHRVDLPQKTVIVEGGFQHYVCAYCYKEIHPFYEKRCKCCHRWYHVGRVDDLEYEPGCYELHDNPYQISPE